MGKNQYCNPADDEDYSTFSFVAMAAQGEQANNSPRLFGVSSNSNSMNKSPADNIFSYDQLHSHQFDPFIMSSQNINKELISSSAAKNSCSSTRSGEGSTNLVKKQVRFETAITEPSKKRDLKEKKKGSKKTLFNSLVSACRECHALEPSSLPKNPAHKTSKVSVRSR